MLIVIFSFFFVTVSSRIVGLIGSSSNPVSGMTIAALLLTSLIWVALGLNDGGAAAKVAVLAVGAVVCISAAAAGDTSQDLKTGFLVGATPKRMQVGEMLGVLACAVTIGFVLIVLNESYGIGTADGLAAPQATLMSLVIDGVLNASLPWTFVFIGIGLALVVEFGFKLPSLAFAVGVYLPVSLMTPILVGGLMRRALTRKYEDAGETEDGVSVLAEKREQGVLYASGLIAGAALVGVLIGGLIYAVTYFTGDPGTASVWQLGHAWMDGLPWLNAVSVAELGAGRGVDGRHPGLRGTLLDAVAGRDAAVVVMKGVRAWCAAAALLVGGGMRGRAAPRRDDQPGGLRGDLRRAQGRPAARGLWRPGIPAEERERVLAENGVTEEELLTFAEVHGADVTFMEQAVGGGRETIRGGSQRGGRADRSGRSRYAAAVAVTPTRSWPEASS